MRDFRVPLSDEARAVVELCRSMRVSDYLFPRPCTGRGLTDVALTKVLNQLGEAGRIHGFRTSFRTWVQDTNAAGFDVAETALGHVMGSKVERAYARSDLLDQRHILMQKWADFVMKADATCV